MESQFNGGEGKGEGSLSSVLSSDTRDFLITPTGDKVSVKETEGNTIGLYFGANWYSKCESFTPVLASVYHQLKDKGSKFKVIFVSSDEDQIEGIPSLIILNPVGKLVCTDGVELINRYGWRAFPFTPERIAVLVEEEKAMHASQTLENLLRSDGRDYVMNHKEQVPISSLSGKTVGLYFSAHKCPPCTKFTSRLAPIYNTLKEKNEDFEIVFVSLDRDEDGYLQCCNDMPWLALPFNAEFSKSLSRYFDIKRIPALVIIGPDGKTVTREGRNLINLHLESAFPFTEAQRRLLQEKMDEEAKSYPSSFNHVGHRHVLNLVSENSGGGPFICCECDEQGLGWAYQCLGCGYEIHLKCVRESEGDNAEKKQVPSVDSFCALSNRGV